MAAALDADVLAPALDFLTLPYRSGATGGVLPLTAGRVTVTVSHRHPVLLLRLRHALVDERLLVRVEVDGVPDRTVVFAPYSEEGSTLPAYAPPTELDVAGGFTVRLTGWHQRGARAHAATLPDGAPMPDDELAELVEARLLTGVLGKLALIGALEKQRLVRHSRELLAGRSLALARRSALDLLGTELGVPRRRGLPGGGDEPDDDYRARLAPFRRFRLPTPSGFTAALNGPGAPHEVNRGLPADVGVKHRFRVVEQTNPVSVALKLVQVGNGRLADLQARLRADHMLDLLSTAPAALPPARRTAWEADRTTLGSTLDLAPGVRYLHAGAARCLALAVRLLGAAGLPQSLSLLRAHDPAGGSEFELGLGLSLKPLPEATVVALAERVPTLAGRDDVDATLRAAAAALTPRPADEDPLAAWFWAGCGFATVTRRTEGDLLLSPFPMRGLRVAGPDDVAVGAAARYDVVWTSAATGGVHVLAARARDRVPEQLAGAGLPAASGAVDGDDLAGTMDDVAGGPDAVPADLQPLVDAGVLPTSSRAHARALLDGAALDQCIGFAWPVADLRPGPDGDIVALVSALVQAVLDGGFGSVRVLLTRGGAELLLVASVSQLPGALSVPGRPPAASYWWTETEVAPAAPGAGRHPLALAPAGPSAVTAKATADGVALVAVVGYHREGLADPYEIRVELDDPAALLTAEQYGHVMNVLESLCPIGIEINTFDLRRSHVDTDGDGRPEWLTSRASRSYHIYRQTRWSRRSADRTSKER